MLPVDPPPSVSRKRAAETGIIDFHRPPPIDAAQKTDAQFVSSVPPLSNNRPPTQSSHKLPSIVSNSELVEEIALMDPSLAMVTDIRSNGAAAEKYVGDKLDNGGDDDDDDDDDRSMMMDDEPDVVTDDQLHRPPAVHGKKNVYCTL